MNNNYQTTETTARQRESATRRLQTSEARTIVSDINTQQLSNHLVEFETEGGSKDVTQKHNKDLSRLR